MQSLTPPVLRTVLVSVMLFPMTAIFRSLISDECLYNREFTVPLGENEIVHVKPLIVYVMQPYKYPMDSQSVYPVFQSSRRFS